MTLLLITFIVLLASLVVGLIWVWILGVPKSEKYRAYESVAKDSTRESSKRNRAWDAAVSRARNHVHGPS